MVSSPKRKLSELTVETPTPSTSTSTPSLLSYDAHRKSNVTLDGRTLRAKTCIPADTTVLEIPFASLINSSQPKDYASSVSTLRKTSSKLITDDDLAMCLNLLDLMSASPPSPYIACLPPASAFLETLPIHFSDAQLASTLKGSNVLLSSIASLKAEASCAFSEVITELRPSSTLPAFLHAWSVVSSRSFSVSDPTTTASTKALVPLLDMCDHSRPRACSYFMSPPPQAAAVAAVA
eukprot:CAMPEP_0182482228 /NCGR_PEP_ID=MMETSP1319-20130603/38873_1 /TAXON_ID=172717 /ORGANISM="Bolidomonas pacifica, Strain RCC208" /LENGTH=235 /DNA_ID=CAMNT_0024683927 /DNA_START=122 /DNA_END=826 /DNA_ORIENTATION=-